MKTIETNADSTHLFVGILYGIWHFIRRSLNFVDLVVFIRILTREHEHEHEHDRSFAYVNSLFATFNLISLCE